MSSARRHQAYSSHARSRVSLSNSCEAAEKRGHKIQVIDVLRCYMNIASHKPTIHYRGEELADFDAVIPRIGASVTYYGTSVLRQFDMGGVYPLNESVADVIGFRSGEGEHFEMTVTEWMAY